jgi:acyl-CoA dehydrogenase
MSSEAQLLRDLVGQVAADHPDEPSGGELSPAWEVLRDLGVVRLGVAEDAGGDGGSLGDLIVVVGALGAHGVGTPMVEAAVANWTLGLEEPLDEVLTTVATSSRFKLHGNRAEAELPVVPWGRAAGRLICASPEGPLFLVDLDADNVTIEPGENLAGEQRDRVRVDGAPARALLADPAQVHVRLALLRTAAIEGAARGAFDLTRSYVREREQFGRPLIEVPAVASGLAEMRMQLTLTGAALGRAAERVERDPADPDGTVAAARVVAASAATAVAAEAHQLHGAMGMTEEYPLHRFTRLLWAWRDAGMSERWWAEILGEKALAAGENGIWEQLTA